MRRVHPHRQHPSSAALAGALLLGALGTGTAQAAVPDPGGPGGPGDARGLHAVPPAGLLQPPRRSPGPERGLLAAYGGRDPDHRDPEIGGHSKHKEGRAWDWGLDAGEARARRRAEQFLSLAAGPGPATAWPPTTPAGSVSCTSSGTARSGPVPGRGRLAYVQRRQRAPRPHAHLADLERCDQAHVVVDREHRRQPTTAPASRSRATLAPAWRAPRTEPCPAPIPAASLTGTPLLKRDSRGPYVTQLQGLLSVSPAAGTSGRSPRPRSSPCRTAGAARHGTTTPETWAAARSGGSGVAPAPSAHPVVPAGHCPPDAVRRAQR